MLPCLDIDPFLGEGGSPSADLASHDHHGHHGHDLVDLALGRENRVALALGVDSRVHENRALCILDLTSHIKSHRHQSETTQAVCHLVLFMLSAEACDSGE